MRVRLRTVNKLLLWIFGVFLALMVSMALTGDEEARELIGPTLVVGATIGAIFGAAWWFRDRPEAQAAEGHARRLGLAFSPGDPFDPMSAGFLTFSRVAQSRDVRHTMWGTWRGLTVRAFEYRQQVNEYVILRFACAATPVPPTWGELAIRGETPIDVAAEALGVGTRGMPEVDFESDHFNRRFDVRASDPAFATALVDQRMMAWMLEEVPPHASFEVHAGWLLAATLISVPWELEKALHLLAAFLPRVPRAVASLYGPAPVPTDPYGSPVR
jgi:hypothetical protein